MRRYLLALGCCWMFQAALPAADWTHWRGPFETGASPEKDLPARWSDDPKDPENNLIWKAPYGCRSTPIVMKGRVYVINYTGDKETIQERVLCLDADTGKTLWEHKFNVFHTDIVTVRLGWTNLAGDPATGNIYAHGTQGLFMCLDGKTGKVVWQHSLSEEFGRITGYGGRVTSPIVDEEVVILGLVNSSWGDQAKGGSRFAAFDKRTGKILWWSEPGGQVKDTYYCVPVVATINGQRLLITGAADGGVYALKVHTGEKVWGFLLGTGGINSSPVVDGHFVYIGHGEENPDDNIQGRFVCLDASKITDGKPELVWKKDGLKARYASPILDREKKRLYIPDEIGKLYCLDAATGKQLWKFSYGRNSRGSPVLGDGKIYVGEVFARFVILNPSDKKCELLHEHIFPSPDGKSDVEINGSPSIANGRVYFSTSDEIICIGKKGAPSAKEPDDNPSKKTVSTKKATHLQVVPAEVAVYPGDSVQFTARLYDEDGTFIKETKAEWSLPQPPLPPGAKAQPPALDGQIADGKLSVDVKKPTQQGYVLAKAEGLVARARVRVIPKLPYVQDFSKVPDGAVPGGWVNTQGKFYVATVNGEKVLKKVNDNPSPLISRGNAYIGPASLKDYTIQCDLLGTKAGTDLPEMGISANRYTLLLAGNIQKLRLVSWDALPRIDKTIPFSVNPDTWYTLKLTFEAQGDKGIARGKCWEKGKPEPAEWTVQVEDPRPNYEGSPALYGYVTGNAMGGSGTDILFDNLKITPNK